MAYAWAGFYSESFIDTEGNGRGGAVGSASGTGGVGGAGGAGLCVVTSFY